MFVQLMLETFCHTRDSGTFLDMMSELYGGKIKWLRGLSSEVLHTQKILELYLPKFLTAINYSGYEVTEA